MTLHLGDVVIDYAATVQIHPDLFTRWMSGGSHVYLDEATCDDARVAWDRDLAHLVTPSFAPWLSLQDVDGWKLHLEITAGVFYVFDGGLRRWIRHKPSKRLSKREKSRRRKYRRRRAMSHETWTPGSPLMRLGTHLYTHRNQATRWETVSECDLHDAWHHVNSRLNHLSGLTQNSRSRSTRRWLDRWLDLIYGELTRRYRAEDVFLRYNLGEELTDDEYRRISTASMGRTISDTCRCHALLRGLPDRRGQSRSLDEKHLQLELGETVRR